MHAAVVREFDRPPRFEDFPAPQPAGPNDELVDVVAVGLHPRVRSQANGSHYTSTDELPLIPGIDGVGRRADGSLVYFVLPDTAFGAMAEQTAIDRRRSIPLAAGADAVLLAAALNPAMSSWVALHKRVDFASGQSVLILGGTGSAGRLAVQIAKHLGASRVVVAGRGARKLDAAKALGADATIDLTGAPDAVAAELAEKAADVDVVLDYLWGKPTQHALMPLLLGRKDRSRLLSWLEIGAIAGSDISLPAAALRQANVRFSGSGQGSITASGMLETLPSLVAALEAGRFSVETVTKPLADVEAVWAEQPAANERVVFLPNG